MSVESVRRSALALARAASHRDRAGWCSVCVDLLSVDGVGITIMGGRSPGTMCVSGPVSATLENAQFTSGEGPCQDAFATGSVVGAPFLNDRREHRWPAFARTAHEQGIEAVFAFPLSVPGARIGALTLYQRSTGELDEEQSEDSATIASILAEAVLSLQSDSTAGVLAPELDEVAAARAEVHQAAGMVAVQLQIGVGEAMLRIRGFAFRMDRDAGDVASDVVNRRIRFTDAGVDEKPETER